MGKKSKSNKINVRFVIVIALVLSCSALFSVSAFFSDCQSFYQIHAKVVEQIVKFQPTTVFIGGDITQNGSRQEEFDKFFEVMQPLSKIAKIYPAMGNHDKDTDLFLTSFPQVDSLTYYSVDRDSVIWIILNSNLKMAPGSKQYNWLVRQLETHQDRTVVVIMHHPVYSSGPHGDEKGFNLLLPTLFKKYSVAAVLSGHDHMYERSGKDGIHYIVFGGGGYKLYNVESFNPNSIMVRKTHGFLVFQPDQDIMTVRAIDIDGNEIDRFTFAIKSKAEADKQKQSR